ncbi:hypothetical protein AAC387_Pa06g0289 [Persea americana]
MHHRSLQVTPTWATATVCFVLILLSILFEAALHLPTKRKRKALNSAVQKIKTELMQMGLISLLLTVGEGPISKICVSRAVGNSFLPCNDIVSSLQTTVANDDQISGLNATTTIEGTVEDSFCEAKLHILIFVLAFFHIIFCIMTMCLVTAKMKRWKAWEEETTTPEYQITNDPRRFRLTPAKHHLGDAISSVGATALSYCGLPASFGSSEAL